MFFFEESNSNKTINIPVDYVSFLLFAIIMIAWISLFIAALWQESKDMESLKKHERSKVDCKIYTDKFNDRPIWADAYVGTFISTAIISYMFYCLGNNINFILVAGLFVAIFAVFYGILTNIQYHQYREVRARSYPKIEQE